MKNRTCHDSLAPFARTAVKVATSLALIGALACLLGVALLTLRNGLSFTAGVG